MKITVLRRCRECNGAGYYELDEDGFEVRVREYEVDIPDDIMKIVNEQIDKENSVLDNKNS